MKKISRRTAVVVSMVVAFVLAISVVALVRRDQPVAEFGSVQEVADNVTEFYSVALDRQDITEGEFILGVQPGKKIVIEALAPYLQMNSSGGTRKVSYSDNGTKISVSTTPKKGSVVVGYDAVVFPDVTSKLRVFWNGEEIEVPVSLRFRAPSGTFDLNSDTAKALLALDRTESHRYIVRVVETEVIRALLDGKKVIRQDMSSDYLIANELSPRRSYVDLKLGTGLPFIAMRGFMGGMELYAFTWAYDDMSYIIRTKERDLILANERARELYGSEGMGTLTAEGEAELLEISAQMREEAIDAADIPEWLEQMAEGNITRETILGVAEMLIFDVQLEVLSIDGIDVSG